MYEVIHYFTDLQDNSYPYNTGDIFPRDGFAVSEQRLRELSGNENRQRKPLIKLVEEEQLPFTDDDITLETKEEKTYTKTEINRMSTAELQELATNEGIGNAYAKSGGELKKILIEYYGL